MGAAVGAKCSSITSAVPTGPGSLIDQIQDKYAELTTGKKLEEEFVFEDDDDDPTNDVEEKVVREQDHLFAFAADLTEEELEDLDNQYAELFGDDAGKWTQAFEAAKLARLEEVPNSIDWQPAPSLEFHLRCMPRFPSGPHVCDTHDVPDWMQKSWAASGREMIVMGKVGVIIMAGGLEARFMQKGNPKGMTDIGLLSKKSLYQIFCERILRLQYLIDKEKKKVLEAYDANEMDAKRIAKKLGATRVRKMREPTRIPLYVMTNMRTTFMTRKYFTDNENFALQEDQVVIFEQDEVPIMDLNGKAILIDKDEILTNPGGNGCLFEAVRQDGVLSDMKARHIEQFFVMSVDNLLTKVADPQFLGYCKLARTDLGIKLVEKLTADEEVGILMRHTKSKEHPLLAILEKSYLTPDQREEYMLDRLNAPPGPEYMGRIMECFEMPYDVKAMRKRSDGSKMAFGHANVCQYVMSMDVLEAASRLMQHNTKGFHWVPTSTKYMDWEVTGQLINPPHGARNAIRLERFISDLMKEPYCKSHAGYLVKRTHEFAPIKYMEHGAASAAHAVGSLSQSHQSWILKAAGPHWQGFKGGVLADANWNLLCEVSPLVSYMGEGLMGAFEYTDLQLPLYIPAHTELDGADQLEPYKLDCGEQYFLEQDCATDHMEDKLREHASVRMVAIEKPSDAAEYEEASERIFGDENLDDMTEEEKERVRLEAANARSEDEKLTEKRHQMALDMITRLPLLIKLDEEKDAKNAKIKEKEEKRAAARRERDGDFEPPVELTPSGNPIVKEEEVVAKKESSPRSPAGSQAGSEFGSEAGSDLSALLNKGRRKDRKSTSESRVSKGSSSRMSSSDNLTSSEGVSSHPLSKMGSRTGTATEELVAGDGGPSALTASMSPSGMASGRMSGRVGSLISMLSPKKKMGKSASTLDPGARRPGSIKGSLAGNILGNLMKKNTKRRMDARLKASGYKGHSRRSSSKSPTASPSSPAMRRA